MIVTLFNLLQFSKLLSSIPPICPGIVTDSILLSLQLGVTDKFFDNVRFFKYLRFVRALEEIRVAKDNLSYQAQDGVLYSKDKKQLFSYPNLCVFLLLVQYFLII